MVLPFTKPEPFTVSVNDAAPATTVAGEMELVTGTGLLLLPPPPLPAGVSVFLQDKNNSARHDTVSKIFFIIPVLIL